MDHAILGTPDLEGESARLWREYGLRALPGGVHLAHGTRNMYVPLGDAYLELTGIYDHDLAARHPIGQYIAAGTADGPRFLGQAVATDDLDAVAARVGVATGVGFAVLPDGFELTYRIAGFDVLFREPYLPGFVTWTSDPMRHPGRMTVEHAAPVHGLSWVEVDGPADRIDAWAGRSRAPASHCPGCRERCDGSSHRYGR